MPYRRKLIEVALPLEAINKESAREKSIRHGHPSTLHLWWARRPLAACRAVLFASLVDDPSEYITEGDEAVHAERERLFKILEDLVLWENINNEEVLDKARLEIARSVARTLNVPVPVGKEAIREFLATKAPPVLDPFAGGGSIPLEAQRLGLRAYASDLNPVAVLINKALIEIPPKFANMPPVHPPEQGDGKEKQKDLWNKEWKGAQGLAEDVRYYGKWMRDEAFKRIGLLYPKAKITAEILKERPDLKAQGLKPGDELTVIAWIWARTVKCPNPACGARMPLAKTFVLSKNNVVKQWVRPQIDRSSSPPSVSYKVVVGKGNSMEGTVNRGGGRCFVCNTPVPFDYIREEGKSKRMGVEMIAIVVESKKSQIYLSPSAVHVEKSKLPQPEWIPDINMPYNPFSVRPPLYGFNTFADIFSNRQLTALFTFGNLIKDTREKITSDFVVGDQKNPQEYVDALSVFLAFAISRGANYWSSLTPWGGSFIVQTFGRQALQMTWDYAEANPFSDSTGNWLGAIDWIARCLETSIPGYGFGAVSQGNAADIEQQGSIISTDPPYYDNVDYADLSDYFYVWLRRSLGEYFPALLSTLLVSKKEELVATPYRFNGDKEAAKRFFEDGLFKVFIKIAQSQNEHYPTTIFYAFKQSETEEIDDNDGVKVKETASTGWETMLEGLIRSKFTITGTLPLRTEREQGLKSSMNALASSVVLVCRTRSSNAPNISRREFLSVLKGELAPALRELQQGSIAPVDLAQAAIGPGMAVFSRFSAVLEADGKPMSVRTALALINQTLDEYLAEQEGEYESDTRWALSWFEQFGHNEAAFGVAETLSKAKNTSVNGLVEAGILEARGGKVRLLRRDELDTGWDPARDKRLTSWEAVQHLIQTLDTAGEQAAGELLARLGLVAETARDLAYRLYTVCERKGWAQDALGYNMLVVAWPRLKELAARQAPKQEKLL